MFDIYESAKKDQWRFTLGKSGSNPLLTIGLNPSTATREKSDTTVAKVEQVAKQHGYDGFVMLNLCAIRATDYHELPRAVNREAFDTNLQRIESIVAEVAHPTIWAAWGNCVSYHSYFVAARDELFARLSKYPVRWVRHGTLTAEGHPRHPSRLTYAWTLEPLGSNA